MNDRPNTTDRSDRALGHLNSMLKTVASSNGVYPSNPEHVAVAVGEPNERGRTSKTAASATAYDPTEFHSLGANYVSKSGSVVLFALPGINSKSVGSASRSKDAFIQTENQIGWAQRMIASN